LNLSNEIFAHSLCAAAEINQAEIGRSAILDEFVGSTQTAEAPSIGGRGYRIRRVDNLQRQSALLCEEKPQGVEEFLIRLVNRPPVQDSLRLVECRLIDYRLGVRVHSDLGNRTVGVQSLLEGRPKTWHPAYFGCVRMLETAK